MFLTIFLLTFTMLLAQQDTTTIPIVGAKVPPGFEPWLILFFVGGIFIHYIIKVKNTLGWSKFLSGVFNFTNLYGWFINDGMKTFIGGFAGIVLALAAKFGLPVSFASLNALSIVLTMAAGYLGDSGFNKGTIQ